MYIANDNCFRRVINSKKSSVMFGENALDTNKQEEKQELLPASVTEAGNEKYLGLGLGLGLPVRVQFTGSVNFGFTTTPGKRAYRQKKNGFA